MTIAEKFEHKGFTVEIHYDDDPTDPRKDFDHMATMYCSHRRYNLGDEQFDPSQFEGWNEVAEYLRNERGAELCYPLYLFDHSGITISCDPTNFYMADSHGWDWGQVGWIYVTADDIKKCFLVDELDEHVLEKAKECMLGEVTEYDQYLTGDVYGFIITGEDDDEHESCWGFYGMQYCIDEAKSVADWLAEQRENKEAVAQLPIQMNE